MAEKRLLKNEEGFTLIEIIAVIIIIGILAAVAVTKSPDLRAPEGLSDPRPVRRRPLATERGGEPGHRRQRQASQVGSGDFEGLFANDRFPRRPRPGRDGRRDDQHAGPLAYSNRPAAIKAGMDVCCEKPLGLTISHGRILADAAAKAKCVFRTDSEFRSIPHLHKAVSLVRTARSAS